MQGALGSGEPEKAYMLPAWVELHGHSLRPSNGKGQWGSSTGMDMQKCKFPALRAGRIRIENSP